MRLTQRQRNAIREETTQVFGEGAVVHLFGSRTDDARRGGDIDLYVDAEGNPAELLDRELKLKARLYRRLGDRRIDVIVHGRNEPLREIDERARRTGVEL